MDTLSSKVTSNHHGESSTYFLGCREYEKNAYDEVLNPRGIIQMGLAENQLSFDLAETWLETNQEPCIFKRNGKSIFRELALFQDYHGLPPFKKALAEFMEEIRGNKVKLDEEKIVLTAGATSANETLMFCLADPGEAFLVPSPYYPGFDRDLKWRTGAEIIPVQCTSSTGFKITLRALQEAHQVAQDLHYKVKGILITNPSNPLGMTLSQEELDLILHYAVANNVHVISDEIYSGTAHSSPPFISILEALNRYSKNSTLHERVHVVYSLSKDLGLPGFRVGIIYSNNKAILEAATKMSSFGLVSSQTQHLLSALLSDGAFVSRYIGENRRRIRKRRRMLVSGLANAGIECLSGNAGLFCWVDMRKFLISNTTEAEEMIWKELIFDVGLNVSPGSSCHCCEPGWFRMCFANLSEETLRVAIQRIQAFAKSKLGPILPHCSAYSFPLRLKVVHIL